MERAWCCDCGQAFMRSEDQRWKVRCWDCWKEWKAREEGGAPPPRSPHSRRSERLKIAADYRALYEQMLIDTLPDKRMLRRLLQLCHPQRHGNSAASLEATHWLLELKKKLPALYGPGVQSSTTQEDDDDGDLTE
jgi:hypothetical protein